MKKVIIFLVGLFIGFAILGATGLPFLLIVIAALWYWTLRRGRLTVRAFMYLGLHSQGISPMEANGRVFKMGYYDAAESAPIAKSFVREYFNGKQLKMIAEARKRGFVG
ncbi:MAG: hypothetical protein EB059_10760 [Alphaproteobacteria bacterium]|nr:hypothetical protein [Alphaproteobacteria bacterium]NDE91591.1 hypothetical protein [Alphaproteobacteria bacterium]